MDGHTPRIELMDGTRKWKFAVIFLRPMSASVSLCDLHSSTVGAEGLQSCSRGRAGAMGVGPWSVCVWEGGERGVKGAVGSDPD